MLTCIYVRVLQAEMNRLGEKVERWVGAYKWKDKIRRAQGTNLDDPNVRGSLLPLRLFRRTRGVVLRTLNSSTQETRHIMNAYVGAVFISGGFPLVCQWIGALVQYGARQRGPTNA